MTILKKTIGYDTFFSANPGSSILEELASAQMSPQKLIQSGRIMANMCETAKTAAS